MNHNSGSLGDEQVPLAEKSNMDTHSHLARTSNDRWIAGVCGGIARWLGWNSDTVRILYILLSICSVAFPGTIVYIILWFAMPVEGDDFDEQL